LRRLTRCRRNRGPFGSAQGRLFDCVVVRVADDNFAQDDRGSGIVESHPFDCAQGRLFRKARKSGVAFFVVVLAQNNCNGGGQECPPHTGGGVRGRTP
jgi:hypothetical protein